MIAAYTYLVGGDHDVTDRDRPVIEQGRRSAGIDVGAGAWIGAGATVLDGVTLGDRAVVGAGAVVREAVPAGATAVGVPARPVGARPEGGLSTRMAVITIVTSAPPLTEGGHLVIARSLERALIEAGHRAGIVTTPSNRFGRQGPAYLANWLTDVGMTGSGERVDQVISLRFPSYAVRHPQHVCWLVHTMREYYDLWDQFSSSISPQGRDQGARAARAHPGRRHLLLQAPREEAVHDFRRRARPARALESRRGRSAAPAAAAAGLPLRRVRRLPVLRLAPDPAEARGSGPARAGAARRRAACAA